MTALKSNFCIEDAFVNSKFKCQKVLDSKFGAGEAGLMSHTDYTPNPTD